MSYNYTKENPYRGRPKGSARYKIEEVYIERRPSSNSSRCSPRLATPYEKGQTLRVKFPFVSVLPHSSSISRKSDRGGGNTCSDARGTTQYSTSAPNMLALTLTADLTGVTDLRPLDTEDDPYFFTFKVQCTSCRETHPNWVNVSRFDASDISGSRGEANFVWKCKACKRESSATIRAPAASYRQASPPTRQSVVEFDCRGLELMEFKADGEWMAKGLESATDFGGIDLQEGEWFDYDEKAGGEVSIRDVKWEIRRA